MDTFNMFSVGKPACQLGFDLAKLSAPFAIFAASFATFAVKIFNREERKGRKGFVAHKGR
jgi:hypothetical protein